MVCVIANKVCVFTLSTCVSGEVLMEHHHNCCIEKHRATCFPHNNYDCMQVLTVGTANLKSMSVTCDDESFTNTAELKQV